MNEKLDKFIDERKSIQEKFEYVIKNGLCSEFITYYDAHLSDDPISTNFKIRVPSSGKTDSGDKPHLTFKLLIENGDVKILLNEDRLDIHFYKENTLERAVSGKHKYATYFRVYVYILKFCQLSFSDFVYLYRLSEVCKSAFYMLGYIGDDTASIAFSRLIEDSTLITDDMLVWLKLQ